MKYSLQQISDRLEIEDLITEYAEAVDQADLARLDEVFTEDAFVDYSAFGGAIGSYAEAREFLAQSLPLFKHSQHMISNFQIKLDAERSDRATGKIMCFNPMQLDSPDQTQPVFFIGLWYIDEYVNTEKGWKIAKRSEIRSWDHNTPEFIRSSF